MKLKRIFSTIMAFIMVISVITIPESGFVIEAEATTTVPNPRDTNSKSPDVNNLYYINTVYTNDSGNHGLNRWPTRESLRTSRDPVGTGPNGVALSTTVLRRTVLPNCTGYAWGRVREIFGIQLPTNLGNATNWYSRAGAAGYARGSTPKLGAIACWGGSFGHVAIVEAIHPNGNITLSHSAYGTETPRWFYTTTVRGNNPPHANLAFQGYIYPDSTAPQTYTVTYNANGGLGVPGSQTKTHGVNLTLSNTRPTRNGHEFLGWANSSNATTASHQPGSIYTSNANLSLWAVWRLNPPPAPPTGLRIERTNENTARLSWNVVSGATSYRVQYRANSGGADWIVASNNITSTSIIISELSQNSNEFRVQAENIQGNVI